MQYPSDKEEEKRSIRGTVLECAQVVVIAVVLAFFIKAFIVQAFKIPSGSMKPALLIGDHILVNKFIYGVTLPIWNKAILHFTDPKREDIIVFRYPVDPSKDFIKRVIGLPGDVVKIRDKKVFINDRPLEEPYAVHSDSRILPAGTSPRDNLDPISVPARCLFVMGDNRDESYDSRFWKFVDFSELKGKAFLVYWSWNQEGETSMNPARSYVRWNRFGRWIR